MADVCIICRKGVSPGSARKVRDDRVIGFIRLAKRVLNIAQNNRLYVCNNDIDEYSKRRKQFEKDVLIFGALAAAILVLLAGLPLLSGKFDIGVFFIAVFMGMLIFVFGALFKYVPALEARPAAGGKKAGRK